MPFNASFAVVLSFLLGFNSINFEGFLSRYGTSGTFFSTQDFLGLEKKCPVACEKNTSPAEVIFVMIMI